MPENFSSSEIDVELFFPKFMYKQGMRDDNICCVCFEEFQAENYIRKLTCNHIFHANCIEE